MIILITGATHTGKTLLAQRLIETCQYACLSIDHLMMGLIRSGQTPLTPADDDELTVYLWPIIREMMKTAIENHQNMILEGCYIPFGWRQDLGEPYASSVQFICLAMTDRYIDDHMDKIKDHASDIEARMDDSYCTTEMLKSENRKYEEGFRSAGESVVMIDDDYEQDIRALLNDYRSVPLCTFVR